MRFYLNAIVLILAGMQVQAQSTSPQCIQSCGTAHPTSSQCDGNETGAALSTCTCNTLLNSQLLQCFRQCSTADQAVYAASIPEPCRSQLFPNVPAVSTSTSVVVSSTTSTSVSTTATSSQSSQSTPTGAATSLVVREWLAGVGFLLFFGM
jgi:hypothetical protein